MSSETSEWDSKSSQVGNEGWASYDCSYCEALSHLTVILWIGPQVLEMQEKLGSGGARL